ncbi:hypothetical protein [Clostridium perfringens]|uniref:hypothetical protein n=1 Tax=Clostridium perfringens TaxID=1502 RepID=UPI001FAD6ED8|nr:hypothetical protein [Clostridium perfringens]
MAAKKLKGSLKHQIIMSLDPLQAYGESKHEAKKIEKARCAALGIPWNPTRVEKIYSIKTYDLYKDKCIRFGEWAKETHKIGNNINNLNKDLARKYLEYREQAGDSPHSLRTHGAAMAKLLRCSSADFGFNYPKRTRETITRSRGDKMHDSEFSIIKNKDIIDFGRGTGLRRSELSLLKPEQIKINDNGRVVIEINKDKYGCQSKGGRSRTVEVLREYQDHIISMRDKALEEHRETVFNKVLNRMDEHALRREYAGLKYKEIENIRIDNKIEIKGDYHTRDGSHRTFDRSILKEVSENLGHNRINVVVKHYLD